MEDLNILQKIEQMLPNLTKTQKLVATEVLAEPTFLAFASVEQMAKKVSVSTASIVRFSNALGYNGYSELQAEMQNYCQRLLNPVDRLDINLTESIDPQNYMESIFQQQVANLRSAYSFEMEGKVRAAVELIKHAEHIFTCGPRGSFAVSYYLGNHLNRVFRNCDILRVDDRLPDHLARMTERDLFIFVNQPRYNRRLLRATQLAKKKGVKIIVITDSVNAPYSDLADVFLAAPNRSRDFHNSMLASMFIDEAIISMIISDQYVHARQSLNELEPFFSELDTFVDSNT